jgi:pyocin large subunit-like protein
MTACAAVGAGLAALSHGTCSLVLGEEPGRAVEHKPSREIPEALPLQRNAERRPRQATKESVEADARGAHDELTRMAKEMAAQEGGADDGAMGQSADPGDEPPNDELPNDDKWSNKESLHRHFRDHGKDFNARSQEEYRRMAVEFLKKSTADKFQIKVDSHGVMRVYDPKTNTFGAYNSDGSVRTFFKPRSPTYFSRQPGVLR